MRTDKEEEVKIMLQEAKMFVSGFDEFVSNLRDAESNSYRMKLMAAIR